MPRAVEELARNAQVWAPMERALMALDAGLSHRLALAVAAAGLDTVGQIAAEILVCTVLDIADQTVSETRACIAHLQSAAEIARLPAA